MKIKLLTNDNINEIKNLYDNIRKNTYTLWDNDYPNEELIKLDIERKGLWGVFSNDELIAINDITPVAEIKNEIITLLESADGFVANLGSIKEKLQKKYPDFDSRNYGCSKFSKFNSYP
jgi:hypothetical protein